MYTFTSTISGGSSEIQRNILGGACSHQAVKHPLVDVMLSVDETRSLVYAAAAAFDHDRANALPAALLAKASASDTAEFTANRGTQLHGGIGFTWESDVQIYHKRLIHSQHLLADGMACRAELGEWL